MHKRSKKKEEAYEPKKSLPDIYQMKQELLSCCASDVCVYILDTGHDTTSFIHIHSYLQVYLSWGSQVFMCCT